MLLSIMCKGSTLPMAYAQNIFLFINVTRCPPKKDDKTPCVAVTNQKRFGSFMFNHVLLDGRTCSLCLIVLVMEGPGQSTYNEKVE